MENMATESHTSAPRVIHVVPQPPRGVAARIEMDGFLEGHTFMSRDFSFDEIERLTLADVYGVYASLTHSDGPASLPEGLRPLLTIRVYASDAGASTMARVASALMPPSE